LLIFCLLKKYEYIHIKKEVILPHPVCLVSAFVQKVHDFNKTVVSDLDWLLSIKPTAIDILVKMSTKK
jgi:hypothetical protein